MKIVILTLIAVLSLGATAVPAGIAPLPALQSLSSDAAVMDASHSDWCNG